MKRKPIIGIIATSNYFLTDDSFCDTYRYGNNYISKIIENNALPYLIPLHNNEMIEEVLDLCDGLIIPGGDKILPSTFDIINYFYNKKKPILGVCLGMQTLAMYSVNKYEKKRIIKKIDNGTDHWPINPNRYNNDQTVHKNFIYKNTKLYDIIGSDEISVNSLHNYTITEVGKDFIVSSKSEDGLIEGIEYKGDDRFILGIQFHPEVLPQYNNIFKRFIKECAKEDENEKK